VGGKARIRMELIGYRATGSDYQDRLLVGRENGGCGGDRG